MTTLDTEPAGSAHHLDAAAAVEIENLNNQLNHWVDRSVRLAIKLEESERQRKLLAEQLERLGRAGIDAAVGAGK